MNEVIVHRDKLIRNLSLEQQKVAIQGQQVLDAREAQSRLEGELFELHEEFDSVVGELREANAMYKDQVEQLTKEKTFLMEHASTADEDSSRIEVTEDAVLALKRDCTKIKKEQVSQLGNGPCIKIMDSQTICDYRMVNYMKEISKLKKIKTQLEILPAGATDTSPLQRMNSGGSIAGAISLPTRHIHQTIEMVNKSDLSNTILFLYECLMEIDTYDWSH